MPTRPFGSAENKRKVRAARFRSTGTTLAEAGRFEEVRESGTLRVNQSACWMLDAGCWSLATLFNWSRPVPCRLGEEARPAQAPRLGPGSRGSDIPPRLALSDDCDKMGKRGTRPYVPPVQRPPRQAYQRKPQKYTPHNTQHTTALRQIAPPLNLFTFSFARLPATLSH